MTRTLPITQPFDLALSLEMGQTFRWRRVGDEEVRNRDWGDPPDPWRRRGGGWYSGSWRSTCSTSDKPTTASSTEWVLGTASGIDLPPIVVPVVKLGLGRSGLPGGWGGEIGSPAFPGRVDGSRAHCGAGFGRTPAASLR